MAGQLKRKLQDRAQRTRKKIAKAKHDRPRLSVHRSLKNISAQIIDDREGKTLASASSLDKSLREEMPKGSDKKAASAVGKAIAEKALKAGVKDVVFDRGAYMYHGRVKALADAAREAGLNF